MSHQFEIKVPASTANLGPAFDTMGLALGLYLTVRGTVLPSGSEGRLTVSGDASDGISLQPKENLICQAAHLAASRLGIELPALDLEIVNDIPLGGGLGSSAAAIVAGVSLVEAVAQQEFSIEEFLQYAMELENHGDNLAPARLGGWILLASCEHSTPHLFRREWPSEIQIVVVRPHFPLATQAMRAVLPDSISRADTIFQMQRVLLLIMALEERRFDLLREAMQDRLHQPYRARHISGLEDILNLSHPGLLATALSGAGPSALALVLENAEEIAAQMQACFARHGHQSTAYLLSVDQKGRTIT